MRTTLLIALGSVLFGLFLVAAHFVGNDTGAMVNLAIKAFIGLWFVAALVNMIMGIVQPGHTFMEELPAFLAIFSVPVAIAVLFPWKLLTVGY